MKKIEITRKALAQIIHNVKGSDVEREILSSIREGVSESEFFMVNEYARHFRNFSEEDCNV
tara:strand:+ start:975 stop:1157 length:183 start_codon:yes stop_codon:yes gene_type:complete